jgi:hypothetical protein
MIKVLGLKAKLFMLMVAGAGAVEVCVVIVGTTGAITELLLGTKK